MWETQRITMAPNENRQILNCPCCGDLVVRVYNGGTRTGGTHFCNSVIYDSPREEKKAVSKTTLKNSAFFKKYKRNKWQ